MCTIPSPCSNFNCCCTPNSRWQRQWIKYFVQVYNTCIPHEPAMKFVNGGKSALFLYLWLSFCFQTYVYHHILYSENFLREKTFANCSLLLPMDAEKSFANRHKNQKNKRTMLSHTQIMSCCFIREITFLV